MNEILSGVCRLKGGTGFPERLQGKKEGDLPLSPNNYVNASVAKQLGATIFPARSVIFAKVGAALLLNRCRMLTTDTLIDNNMMGAVATGMEPDFLYHFLTSVDFAKYAQIGALPSLNQKALGTIPIPPFSTRAQRRMAEILSTLEEVTDQAETQLAKYRQIKAALMHDLFTRGATPDGRLRAPRSEAPHLYKESSLGWIPKGWETFTVRKMFVRRTERGRPGLPVMAITMAGGLVERDSAERRVDSRLTPVGHLLLRTGDIAYNTMRMWQGVLGRATYDCLVSLLISSCSPAQWSTRSLRSTSFRHPRPSPRSSGCLTGLLMIGFGYTFAISCESDSPYPLQRVSRR
jgi:hypothetical protein